MQTFGEWERGGDRGRYEMGGNYYRSKLPSERNKKMKLKTEFKILD